MRTITYLGQAQPQQAQPQLYTTGLAQTLEERYRDLRSKCIENYGPDFCNTVLPRNLVYAVTSKAGRTTIPWWLWMIAGAFVGRLVR